MNLSEEYMPYSQMKGVPSDSVVKAHKAPFLPIDAMPSSARATTELGTICRRIMKRLGSFTGERRKWLYVVGMFDWNARVMAVSHCEPYREGGKKSAILVGTTRAS